MAGRATADLAHDMRDALAAIRNAAHRLAVDRDGAAAEGAQRVVARQAERLTALVDELAAPT